MYGVSSFGTTMHPVTATLRNDVYDTATGRWLLIPQGATILGEYQWCIRESSPRIGTISSAKFDFLPRSVARRMPPTHL